MHTAGMSKQVFFMYRVYFVSIDNILMWICEMQNTIFDHPSVLSVGNGVQHQPRFTI
jgi:hypothetical protein